MRLPCVSHGNGYKDLLNKGIMIYFGAKDRYLITGQFFSAMVHSVTMVADHYKIHVRCYAGYCGEEIPLSFSLGGREVGVCEIMDRWLSPEHRYFKLRGDDGGVYILRYDVGADQWELTMFDSGTRDETRLSST